MGPDKSLRRPVRTRTKHKGRQGVPPLGGELWRVSRQCSSPPLDWAAPLDLNGLQSKIIRPALEAVGLPASRPAATGTAPAQPATKGVRLHDLRHTAATLWLTAGVHFMQVSKWLGHSSYVLTLTTYGDYIPDEEATNPLPEPVAPAAPATNVRKLPASLW